MVNLWGLHYATDTTDILTCPSGKVLKVKTIIVSNINGSTNASTTVYFYDSSATDRYALASTINVPADASLVVLETTLYFIWKKEIKLKQVQVVVMT